MSVLSCHKDSSITVAVISWPVRLPSTPRIRVWALSWCLALLTTRQYDQIWRHFAISAKSSKSWAIFRVYLLFGEILDWLWQILYAIGEISIDVNGQMLKNKLTIWSQVDPHLKHAFVSILSWYVVFCIYPPFAISTQIPFPFFEPECLLKQRAKEDF